MLVLLPLSLLLRGIYSSTPYHLLRRSQNLDSEFSRSHKCREMSQKKIWPFRGLQTLPLGLQSPGSRLSRLVPTYPQFLRQSPDHTGSIPEERESEEERPETRRLPRCIHRGLVLGWFGRQVRESEDVRPCSKHKRFVMIENKGRCALSPLSAEQRKHARRHSCGKGSLRCCVFIASCPGKLRNVFPSRAAAVTSRRAAQKLRRCMLGRLSPIQVTSWVWNFGSRSIQDKHLWLP